MADRPLSSEKETDDRPKAVDVDPLPRLTWVIAESGECVVGLIGAFMAFRDAAGAAWTLRRYADAIEKDDERSKIR